MLQRFCSKRQSDPPLYEFPNVGDHLPSLMHDNDGAAMDLLGHVRKKSQEFDRDEKANLLFEDKKKLEEEITSLKEQLETIVDTIKIISEEFDRIGDDSEESKARLSTVLFEEMRDFELVQASLRKKKSGIWK